MVTEWQCYGCGKSSGPWRLCWSIPKLALDCQSIERDVCIVCYNRVMWVARKELDAIREERERDPAEEDS